MKQDIATIAATAQDDILDVRVLAAMLHLHPVTIRLMSAAGTIPGKQIGNRWRFSRARIMAWLDGAA